MTFRNDFDTFRFPPAHDPSLFLFPFPRGKGLGVRFFTTMKRISEITRLQSIESEKLSFAKRLRQEMTAPERRLWKALRRNAIDGFHFRRQQVIGGYIVDFYCDAAKLAIELDGGAHEGTDRYDSAGIGRFPGLGSVFSEFRMRPCSTLRWWSITSGGC